MAQTFAPIHSKSSQPYKVTRLEETIQPLRFRSFLGLTATALSFTAALRLRAIFR